jgi:sec-independent protein translocase protein TatA
MDVGKPEILILLIVILVLFGAKRLPGAARSLGQSMRIFKAETKGLRGDEDDAAAPNPAALPVPPTAGAPGTMPIAPVPPAVQDQAVPDSGPLHQ